MIHLVVYTDTSIYLGYFDSSLKAGARILWRMHAEGYLRFKISELTRKYLNELPLRVRALADGTLKIEDILSFDEASEVLAKEYIKYGILESRHSELARNIAICSIGNYTNYISSHVTRIITPEKNEALNCFNQLQGYSKVKILSPTDFVHCVDSIESGYFQINTHSSFLTQPV